LTKIILLVVVAVVAYAMVKNFMRRNQDTDGPPARHKSDGEKPTGSEEDMVRCAHCGVHLPRSESLLSKGNYFCGSEHRALFKK
jgi:uncharacterized protein